MGRAFGLEPKDVRPVGTRFRKIVTKIPAPGSLETLQTLFRCEPISMTGQPPVLWDRAEGYQVYDRYGNMWLDWSSGVLVANAGHAAKEVRDAILHQVEKGLLHNYCFPSAERAELVTYLVEITPERLDKVLLLTTGAEATECAIKLSRTYGQKVGGREKIGIVSFEGAFHLETYQGGGASFAPRDYIQALARWCAENDVLLTFDEIQAGFGRTGKLFGFEHYDVVPDLVCCGKGISSSLPLSAVIGRSEVMDLYGPAEMTSTHTGNPVCAAAALASIRKIVEGGLIENAAAMGKILFEGLQRIAERHRELIGAVHGRGLVAGLHIVRRGSQDPDGDLAFSIVERAFQKGLLMFAPVGLGGATVKISPPLTITAEAILDGLSALGEAIREASSGPAGE